jgi:GntR family transcriptional regulator
LPALSGVNRQSPVPLYHQVVEDLRAKISQGAWPPESQLPNERELCELYHVSQITVRHALQILADEGVIVRNQGSGTFVRATTLTEGLRGLSSFSEEMKALGAKAGGLVLRKRVVKASAEQARALHVAEGSDVFELYRLRTADSEPIGLQASYLPVGRFPDIDKQDFEDVSLYELLERQYALRLFEAIETFRMGRVSAREAGLLKVKAGSSAFVVERCTFDVHGPFEVVRSIMRGDRYQIRMRLVRP